ncbi:MAG: TIGR04255 family protein [Chloroflexi bacterium]|nr:TIGR04255 family protein [Chloroflexota bacterium]
MEMTGRPLPDFAEPPLVEMLLSLQFDSLPGFGVPQIGLLWSLFRERFPKTEDHPSLDPVFERFDPLRVPFAPFRFQAFDADLPFRSWFLNTIETELIQIQSDRFIHNWRQGDSGEIYPRYNHVLTSFKRELEVFQGFLRSEGLGEVRPNQCEVTYINHIVSEKGWDRLGQLSDILSVWRSQKTDQFLPESEEISFSARYIIPDDTGKPVGRLHISANPAYRKSDNKPVIVLNLTARGNPDGEGMDGVFRFFDKGHVWIVRGFADMTTSHMQALWRRRDG